MASTSLSVSWGPATCRSAGSTRELNCSTLRKCLSRPQISASASSAGTKTDSSRIALGQGGNELQICRVLNGMWQTSSSSWGLLDRRAAVEAMLSYADNGLTSFDMADIYGPAEELYGAFINRLRRERGEEMAANVQGCTKWCPMPSKMTRNVVENAINKSRKRMDVPCLDLLQFHWWDYGKPGYIDALKHLTDLKEEGKIKALGLTNFDTEHLQKVLEAGIPVVSNQVQHSLVDQRPQQRMAELCSLTGVQFITYGTVMGGLLSDKYIDQKEPGTWGGPSLGTPSLKKYKQMVDAWGGWDLFQKLLRECRQVARKHGASISSVAVRYTLDQPSVAGSMVGVRLGQSEHILDSKKIFDLQLDEEDKERLQATMKEGNNLLELVGDCGDEYR